MKISALFLMGGRRKGKGEDRGTLDEILSVNKNFLFRTAHHFFSWQKDEKKKKREGNLVETLASRSKNHEQKSKLFQRGTGKRKRREKRYAENVKFQRGETYMYVIFPLHILFPAVERRKKKGKEDHFS